MTGEGQVTVVCAVYNGAAYLREALESALAQTRPPAELIVVDDGSEDDSGAVAERLGVTVVRQPNAGVGPARNRGVDLARGDHISFLDADDIWDPHKLEAQIAALCAEPSADGVFCWEQRFGLSELSDADRARRGEMPPRPATIAGALTIGTEAMRAIGPFRSGLLVSEFLDWLLRARRLGHSFTMVDRVLVHRRVHTGNVTTAAGAAGLREYARTLADDLRLRRAEGAS